MKNILMYVIVIAIVIVGVWLFMRKGSNGTADLYNDSPTPTSLASASASPTVSPVTAGKVVTTSDGLQYQDEVVGSGAAAKAGQAITVNYTGMLTNGTKFDSNVDPAFGHVQPFSFTLGAGQVIKGWDEGFNGMKVGGKRKLIIPAALAYGSQSPSPLIPANSALIFEVELTAVQ